MNTVGKIRIVYPHTPETDKLARRLQRELLSYRIPGAIRKKRGINTVGGLQEDWLIVLCTPETPENPEVLDAIAGFTAQGRKQQILTLLVSGRPEESFPAELTRDIQPDGTVVMREPLAANVSAPTEKVRLKKLKVEKLRLLAPVLGVSFDDLRNRRRIRRMKILIPAGAVILAAAMAFLVYALNRVSILSSQNRELNAQLTAEQEALSEAEAQRNAAEQEYARQIAEVARRELGKRHTETALLLCMDLLRRDIRNTELQDVFGETLETMSAQGYVPMDDVQTFLTRRNRKSIYTETEKERMTDELFPLRMNIAVPDDADTEADYLQVNRQNNADDGSVGHYYGRFKTRENEEIPFSYFHFPADREKDYFLRDGEGNYLRVNQAVFLADGTMIVCDEQNETVHRAKQETGELIPLTDGRDQENPFPSIKELRTFDGSDLIFGLAAGSHIEVFSSVPFRHLETVYGVSDLSAFGGTRTVYEANELLQVFSLDPFRLLYRITQRDGYNARYADAVETAPGKGFLQYGHRIFDLYTGELLTDINERFSDARQVSDFSSDGFLLITMEDGVAVWDQNRQEIREKLDTLGANFYGVWDESSGRCSAERIRTGDGIWRLWREEAVPVPGTPEEQIALAEEYLAGVNMKESERETYHLD